MRFVRCSHVAYIYWGEGLESIPCALMYSRRCARHDCLYVNESKTHNTHNKLLSFVQDRHEFASLSLFLLCVWVFASTSGMNDRVLYIPTHIHTREMQHSVSYSIANITIRTLAALGKRTAFVDDTRKCFVLFYTHYVDVSQQLYSRIDKKCFFGYFSMRMFVCLFVLSGK